MKILSFNDPHFTLTPPVSRTETYAKDIILKIKQVFELARKRAVDVVVCSGDVFHRKGLCTPREGVLIQALFKTCPVPLVGILGSHDVTGHNPDTAKERIIGMLIGGGQYRMLDREPVKGDGVLLTGRSCTPGYDVEMTAYVKNEEERDWFTVCVTHGNLLLREKGSWFGDYTTMGDLRKLDGELHDVILNGHIHTYQEPFKIGSKTVFSDGSLARNIMRYDDMDRVPSVRYLEVNRNRGIVETELIALKVRPAVEVFVAGVEADEGGESALESDSMRSFVETLARESGELRVAEDRGMVRRVVEELGFGREIEDEVMRYMETEA